MNSSKIRFAALIAALFVFIIDRGCVAVTVSNKAREKVHAGSKGIFGRMMEEVTKPERFEAERHKATLRKKQQLAEAEQEYQQIVQEDQIQEEKEKRAVLDEQEKQQQKAVLKLPQSKMLTATGEESQINIGELEANIQANLQAKIDAGASMEDLMASIGQDGAAAPAETYSPSPKQSQTLMLNEPQQQGSQQLTKEQNGQQSGGAGAQETSMEKVKLIAKKLDIPFTNDLLALGSNAAISDALIEQAMANGKTDAEINEAMETL